LEAEAKRKVWMELYRTKSMRQEVDRMVDMAWEVINFDYVIAAWRIDMDTATIRRGATTVLEVEEVTVMLESLWME
jgi:hypothetical protein